MGTALVLLASLAITIGSVGWQEWVSSRGSNISTKALNLARQVYTNIVKNQNLLDQVTDAYNSQNNTLLTQLMQGAGFGARDQSIRDAIKELKSTYNSKKKELTDKISKQTNDYNELQYASNNNGTLSGVKASESIVNKIEPSVEQNINGGIQNER